MTRPLQSDMGFSEMGTFIAEVVVTPNFEALFSRVPTETYVLAYSAIGIILSRLITPPLKLEPRRLHLGKDPDLHEHKTTRDIIHLPQSEMNVSIQRIAKSDMRRIPLAIYRTNNILIVCDKPLQRIGWENQIIIHKEYIVGPTL